MAIPSGGKPSGAGAMPIPTNMSIADMYTGLGQDAPFASDPFGNQEVFGMSGSLGKMSGRSLEDMMMGMSMDSTMEGMGSSIGDFLSTSPGNELNVGGTQAPKVKKEGAAQPMECPISPAQRIKRDRATSVRNRTLSGSEQGHPAQKMRQGPGPGSLKSNPDDVLGWSISPSMLDDELV
jgi:hypothetical protein